MPTVRQGQILQKLELVLSRVSQNEAEFFVQSDRLGHDLSFEFLNEVLSAVVAAARSLQKIDLTQIPFRSLESLLSGFQSIGKSLDGIKNFSPASGESLQQRQALAEQLEDHWAGVFPTYTSALASASSKTASNQVLELTAQVQSALQLSSEASAALTRRQEEAKEQVSQFLSEQQEKISKQNQASQLEIGSVLLEAKRVSAIAGVSQNEVFFSQEAEEHRSASTKWAIALVISVLLLCAFGIWGAYLLQAIGSPEPSNAESVIGQLRFLSQKALIVFGLIFAVLWSGKNYSAAKHNYVVNKHRRNALGSFQAFAVSATDDQTKNAVLIQATQSIFAPQASGYVKTDGDNTPAGQVIEIIRSVSGKDK